MAKQVTKNTGEMTRADVQAVLDSIAAHVVDGTIPPMHSMVMLNTVIGQTNAESLFDEELKTQARDLWTNLKASGLELIDPPLLFGNHREFIRKENSADAS